MKINAEKIGFSKPFDVKPSVKLELKSDRMTVKALKLQALQVKANDIDPTSDDYADTVIKVYEEKDQMVGVIEKFLKDVFKLSDKQIEHVEETVSSSDQLNDYVLYVVQRLRGMSDKQIELANEKQAKTDEEADPKK